MYRKKFKLKQNEYGISCAKSEIEGGAVWEEGLWIYGKELRWPPLVLATEEKSTCIITHIKTQKDHK